MTKKPDPKEPSFIDPNNLQRPQNTITRHSKKPVVFTVGHSNVSSEKLLERLRMYEINRVIDVRTKPYSRWCPQFNRLRLEQALKTDDIGYDWLGNRLGGLSENVGYDEAIRWVYDLAKNKKVVLICSEGDFRKCHRYSMLTPDLERLGAELVHIRLVI